MKKISFNEAASKNVMTASQMKQIKGGGGTCGYFGITDDGVRIEGCQMSKEQALFMFNEFEPGQRRWCCDNCGKTFC